MGVLTFSTIIIRNTPILRIVQRNIIIHIHRPSCKLPVILVRFQLGLKFLNKVSKSAQISNLIKILPVGVELFHAIRQTRRSKQSLFRIFRKRLKTIC
jgi:hypothetical protein